MVENQHHRPARLTRSGRVILIKAPEEIGEIAGALAGAGDGDQLAGGMVERAEERTLPRPTGRLDP
jgi:hypothetical protein